MQKLNLIAKARILDKSERKWSHLEKEYLTDPGLFGPELFITDDPVGLCREHRVVELEMTTELLGAVVDRFGQVSEEMFEWQLELNARLIADIEAAE